MNALEDAISSGEFLEYDHKISNFRIGSTQEALLTLRNHMENYKTTFALYRSELDKLFLDLMQQKRGVYLTCIDQLKIASLYNSHFMVCNQILQILKHFYQHTQTPIKITKFPIPMFERSKIDNDSKKINLIKNFLDTLNANRLKKWNELHI